MSKNPSSEEIAAALEVAITTCEQACSEEPQRGVRWPNEESAPGNAATTLRSHLSRLREEAAFRDAALKHAKDRAEFGGYPRIGSQSDDEFVAAYRAMEIA